jgi:hypothetical protein
MPCAQVTTWPRPIIDMQTSAIPHQTFALETARNPLFVYSLEDLESMFALIYAN